MLVGVLAQPGLREALGLEGAPATVPGRLAGGAGAGLPEGGWPWLLPGPGAIAAWRLETPTPALERYAEVFGLAPVATPAGTVLGITAEGGEAEAGDTAPGDTAADARLAAALAAEIAGADASQTPADLRRRLPQIAVAVASRLRAADTRRPAALLPSPDADAVRIEARSTPHAGFFAVERLDIVHRHHDGGLNPRVTREVLVAGDAVIVLPWDPLRDRVMVIDQFRAAVAARGEAQAWMLEPIAGRIDPRETPAGTALREAAEEARLTLDPARLIEAPASYPSPGVLAEYIYAYVAPCDLPDGCAGLAGLEAEGEDIRAHLLPRAELTRMALAGELPNGPLALIALWLALEAPRLAALDACRSRG